jgi:predicted ArsR family transcriptional regulator
MQYTVKEYAEKHGISVVTARKRLDKLVAEGKATKTSITREIPKNKFNKGRGGVRGVKAYLYIIKED